VNKKTIEGFALITVGICMPLLSMIFSSSYDSKDRFIWNIARSFITGEIVLRESVIEIVPDRDETLYREFTDYKANHPEFQNLTEDQLIDKFYKDHYKDKMYKMELTLKLTKQKVVTHKNKIAIPQKYIFVLGVLLTLTGIGIIISQRRRSDNNSQGR
jgi:hypothetical protein